MCLDLRAWIRLRETASRKSCRLAYPWLTLANFITAAMANSHVELVQVVRDCAGKAPAAESATDKKRIFVSLPRKGTSTRCPRKL